MQYVQRLLMTGCHEKHARCQLIKGSHKGTTVGLRLNPYYLLIHNIYIFASFPWAKLVVPESFGSLTLGGDLHLGDNRLTTLPESFPLQNSKLVTCIFFFCPQPPEEGTHPSQAVCQMTSIAKSRDEEIPRRIMRYMDQHSIRVSAWLLCTLVIVSYEFMAYVKLPITGIGRGSAIGTSPLIMSSMVYGVSTVEFKLEAELDAFQLAGRAQIVILYNSSHEWDDIVSEKQLLF